jgi:hypothetical protein
LHGDPPEVDPADGFERGPDDVVGPDRYAAAHDDDVGLLDASAHAFGSHNFLLTVIEAGRLAA